MKRSIVPLGFALSLAILIGGAPASADGPPFELKDGDRVVLIGGTMIERDQETGYLETRLTRRYPDRSITFRNLGWSGDTVEGTSQAGFGSTADGFKHLVEHVLALKPTVVILGYGANEAFEGQAGLAKFLQGFDKLLKAIEPTKARLVFLSPTRQEDLGRPLPDPTRHNADLALYRGALRDEAKKRGGEFVNLYQDLNDVAKLNPGERLTDNGIHFTPQGYWRLAEVTEEALFDTMKTITGMPATAGEVAPVDLSAYFDTNFQGHQKTPSGVRFKLLDAMLPVPQAPQGGTRRADSDRKIRVAGLKPGRYALKVDGQPVAFGDASAWERGIKLDKGPELDQVEALRSAINAKNQLYFYRWRPQNETYLFGFCKHEQGKNAREIAQFDPLIAAKEAEIARLRVPVPHTYELIREGEVGK